MSASDHDTELGALRARVAQQLREGRPAPMQLWLLVLVAAMAAVALTMEWTRRVDSSSLAKEVLADPAFKASALAAMQSGVASAPVGCVVAWPSNASLPDGWHICDGKELSANEYPELTDVLKATYGKVVPGNVKLPDFQGYFLRGQGSPSAAIGVRQPAAANPLDIKWNDIGASHLGVCVARPTLLPIGTGSKNLEIEIVPEASGRSKEVEPLADDTRPQNYAVHWIIRIK